MKTIKAMAALIVLPMGLGGCATVINGTSQDVQVASQPSGATVEFTGGIGCTAPCELSLKRKDDYRADFVLDGYKSEYVYVQSRTGGGLIGGVVDASNGASNSLYPRPLHVRLVADGSTDEAVLLGKEGEVVSTVAEHNYKVRDDVEKSLMKRGLMTSTDKPVMIVTEEEAALIQAKANSEETVDSQENELPSEAVAEESENEPDGSQPE
jgi:predicted small secreted protein